MKVALVLTGLARCFEQAYPSFKEYVLDRYDTDVYVDIWSEVGYYTGKGYLPTNGPYVNVKPGERGFHDSGEKVDANRIMELYNPKVLHIEDFNQFEPVAEIMAKQYPIALTRPKNTICQAYKIYKGMKHVPHINYDVIVRARPDIVLEHDPGMFSRDELLTLPSKNSRGLGTGDSIQIGGSWLVYEYAQMFTNLHNLYHHVGYSCPHAYAEEWIKMRHLPWREMQVGAHVAHSPRGAYQEPE